MNLHTEFQSYRNACYGDRVLPSDQEKEIEQAFLSGIVAACSSVEIISNPSLTIKLARHRLTIMGCFPQGHN